jgi:hypothetical protein
MVYRLDVILEDGARRRASYDTDKPQIIEISKCPFGPKDVMLKGASCITTSPELKKLLNDNGFQTQRPGKTNNYCVRMDDAMADAIFEIAQDTGKKEAAVIRIAVSYWLAMGHPIE